jgi:hypothetical protein
MKIIDVATPIKANRMPEERRDYVVGREQKDTTAARWLY